MNVSPDTLEFDVNSITADTLLHQSLPRVTGLTEVRDTNGNLLGYYSPVTPSRSTKLDAATFAEAAARIDPEELKRRKESQEREYTTAEVLEHLKTLGK
jgi:hypothetical protein